jgi:DnaJ-class molecular chaperone
LRNSSYNIDETDDLFDNLRGASNVESEDNENQNESDMNQIPGKITLEKIYHGDDPMRSQSSMSGQSIRRPNI